MPPHVADRLPDDHLRALTQMAAQKAGVAAQALKAMTPHVADRLPDADLRAPAQAAAREADAAADGLLNLPPHVLDRLLESDLRALARAAAQDEACAAQMLHDWMAQWRDADSMARMRAMRLECALIAAAADVLPADALIAWALAAPPEALAHGDARAALLARARADKDFSQLLPILEERLIPPDASLSDPEMRFTPQGSAITTFRVATNRSWKDETEWFRVVAWDKLAEICNEYLKKGSRVYVEGRLQTRSWDDRVTGEKRFMTEVVAQDVIILTPKSDRSALPAVADSVPSSGVMDHTSSLPASDDDLPF